MAFMLPSTKRAL